MEVIRKICLTDEAISYIKNFGMPIMAKDFLGYLILIDKDNGCFVGLDNSFIPVSNNSKKPKMSKKRAKRIFRILQDSGFLKDASNDPFPEMEKYNNIKFNPNVAFKIDGNLMESTINIKADDDLFGIEEFLGEDCD